jgi:S-DNA-T family DNA segregation ATPase FtsK/SpoIIIE
LQLPIGLLRRTLGTAVLELHEGEHVLIAGAPRSGRTTAAATISVQWRRAVGEAATLARVFGRHANADGSASSCITGPADEVARRLAALAPLEPVLLVVDDAELVHDDGGALTSLLAQRRPHLHVVATGRADALRAEYGHWTTAVRRSRTGLLLGAVHELDADLLGVVLRRRRDAALMPPGRGQLVAAGGVHELQVALAGADGEPPTGGGDHDDLALVGSGGAVGSAGQRCFG